VKLDQRKHPAGTRLIAAESDCSYHQEHPFEVTVVEWSPKGRVKVRYESGSTTWRSYNARAREEEVARGP
jgi:hypothetical protein